MFPVSSDVDWFKVLQARPVVHLAQVLHGHYLGTHHRWGHTYIFGATGEILLMVAVAANDILLTSSETQEDNGSETQIIFCISRFRFEHSRFFIFNFCCLFVIVPFWEFV